MGMTTQPSFLYEGGLLDRATSGGLEWEIIVLSLYKHMLLSHMKPDLEWRGQ